MHCIKSSFSAQYTFLMKLKWRYNSWDANEKTFNLLQRMFRSVLSQTRIFLLQGQEPRHCIGERIFTLKNKKIKEKKEKITYLHSFRNKKTVLSRTFTINLVNTRVYEYYIYIPPTKCNISYAYFHK